MPGECHADLLLPGVEDLRFAGGGPSGLREGMNRRRFPVREGARQGSCHAKNEKVGPHVGDVQHSTPLL